MHIIQDELPTSTNTSTNRAYLVLCLRHAAQIQSNDRTEETLRTLYAIDLTWIIHPVG